MVENALGEGLSLGEGSEQFSESERFSDWEVSLDDGHWGSGDLFFLDDETSSLVETVVDSSHGIHWAGNLSLEDGLLESGFSGQLTSVVEFSGGWDDLSGTSVDGIGVQDGIQKVDSDTSHVFFTDDSFLGSPLPGRLARVLNFVHELDGLGGINQQVGSAVLRSE